MSIVLNTDQILTKIHKQGYRFAKIFEGFIHYESMIGKGEKEIHFDRFDCKSSDELAIEIKEFAKNFPGRFTLIMRVHNGGTDKSLCACRWTTNEEAVNQKQEQQSASAVLNGVVANSVEDLKKQWLEEMKTQFQIKELETRLNAKDAELKGIHSHGDKLAYVFMQVLQSTTLGKKLVGGTMNGTMNGSEKKPMQDLKPEPIKDVDGYKRAVNRLHALLGEETLIKLADKLTEESTMEINFIKNFANT